MVRYNTGIEQIPKQQCHLFFSANSYPRVVEDYELYIA